MAVHDIRRAARIDIKHNLRESFVWAGTVVDQDGAAVDLSGKSLIYSVRSTENGTALFTFTSNAGDIGVSGSSNNVITISGTLTGLSGRAYHHDLENLTDNRMVFDGRLLTGYGAYND